MKSFKERLQEMAAKAKESLDKSGFSEKLQEMTAKAKESLDKTLSSTKTDADDLNDSADQVPEDATVEEPVVSPAAEDAAVEQEIVPQKSLDEILREREDFVSSQISLVPRDIALAFYKYDEFREITESRDWGRLYKIGIESSKLADYRENVVNTIINEFFIKDEVVVCIYSNMVFTNFRYFIFHYDKKTGMFSSSSVSYDYISLKHCKNGRINNIAATYIDDDDFSIGIGFDSLELYHSFNTLIPTEREKWLKLCEEIAAMNIPVEESRIEEYPDFQNYRYLTETKNFDTIQNISMGEKQIQFFSTLKKNLEGLSDNEVIFFIGEELFVITSECFYIMYDKPLRIPLCMIQKMYVKAAVFGGGNVVNVETKDGITFSKSYGKLGELMEEAYGSIGSHSVRALSKVQNQKFIDQVFASVFALRFSKKVVVQAPQSAPIATESQLKQQENDDGPLAKLKKLGELHAAGVLDDAEFAAAKSKLLAML